MGLYSAVHWKVLWGNKTCSSIASVKTPFTTFTSKIVQRQTDNNAELEMRTRPGNGHKPT